MAGLFPATKLPRGPPNAVRKLPSMPAPKKRDYTLIMAILWLIGLLYLAYLGLSRPRVFRNDPRK